MCKNYHRFELEFLVAQGLFEKRAACCPGPFPTGGEGGQTTLAATGKAGRLLPPGCTGSFARAVNAALLTVSCGIRSLGL